MYQWLKFSVFFCIFLFLTFIVADKISPLPSSDRIKSVLVVASDGTPLRAFADQQGVWRYPVDINEVSPLYLEALINYEDRWFYWHPGVNPLAMVRALWQMVWHQRTISGGSTLTMQVARILDPHKKNLAGKLKQMARALQLEWHYSKDEILNIYLNLAPYGGPIEGVQTASYAYLQKSVKELSHAEAALLAVLPQAPSRLRPDRHPERAQRSRDKVLDRMQSFGLWSALTVSEAKMEGVEASRLHHPMIAPLLSRYLKNRQQKKGKAGRNGHLIKTFINQSDSNGVDQNGVGKWHFYSRINTTINPEIQWALEDILKVRSSAFPEQVSAAVLVVENETGFVQGYAGSTDFLSTERFGQVDMVQAIRSPGSTLKPFLYGMALDEGIVHSESLLSDVPIKVRGYSPKNFHRSYQGAVSVREALQKSLNVPAVDMMQRIGSDVFVSRLKNAGLDLYFPDNAEPNLAMVLGGAGSRMEYLVRAYTALARKGVSIKPRYTAEDEIVERRMLSEGASWIIRDILQDIPLPGGSANVHKVAWKTGTSYGFRDAWAIGLTDRFTIGVWTGRPDGTPSPGRYGAFSAAPILFDVVQTLPKGGRQHLFVRPDNVVRKSICWPLGLEQSSTKDEDCHAKHKAWILNDQVPPTLQHLKYPDWSAKVQPFWIDQVTGRRVQRHCSPGGSTVKKLRAKWPTELYPWLNRQWLEKSRLPKLHDNCIDEAQSDIDIISLDDNAVMSSVQGRNGAMIIALEARGGKGQYYWLVNDRFVARGRAGERIQYSLEKEGNYRVTVVDDSGGFDRVSVRVTHVE